MSASDDAVRDLGVQIDLAVRAGVAAAVRMQAAALRSTASLMASEARTLDEMADGIEDGTVEMPARAVKLTVVPLDDEPEPEPADDDEPETLVRIDDALIGDSRMLTADSNELELSAAMIEWIDGFDDRLRLSPHFVTAVNEAADAELLMNEDAQRMVAARVYELTEGAG